MAPGSIAREPWPSVRGRAGGRASAMAVSGAVHLGLIAALCLLVLQRQAPPPERGLELAVVAAPAETRPAETRPAETRPAETHTERLPAAVVGGTAVTPLDFGVLAATTVAPAVRYAGARRHSPAPAVAAAAAVSPPPAVPAAPAAVALSEGGTGALAALAARIHRAVQAAAVYPSMARLTHREGRAELRFDYAGGVVRAVSLVQSSHSALLDDAALAAVHRAALPPAPVELADRTLTLLVWVDFNLSAVD